MEFNFYLGLPDSSKVKGIQDLHRLLFEGSELTMNELTEKKNLLICLAIEENEVIAFKMGYETGHQQFFSWLGGVNEKFRKLGIASTLMNLQHEVLKEKGYLKIQTHSRNNRKAMLILNIKHGFDVIETFKTEKGKHRILLEKIL